MSDILLETHALTKQFRKHKAVDEINMHIKRGVSMVLLEEMVQERQLF